jgi:tetratricopeptide (TPR) repeat protein
MLSAATDLSPEPGTMEILRPGSARAQYDTRRSGGFLGSVIAMLAASSIALIFPASTAAQTAIQQDEKAGTQQEQAAARPARIVSSRERVKAERYEIDVAFQPEKGFLHARATLTLRALETISAIEFELNPRLHILNITDAQGRKLAFDRSGRIGSPKLSVRLAEPIHAANTAPGAPAPSEGRGITFALTFTYEGVLPQKPLDYITKDGILLRDESRWYPAVDLSAFTQNDITITVPSGWLALTSGELKSTADELSSPKVRYITFRPISSRAITASPYLEKNCPVWSESCQAWGVGSFDTSEGGPHGLVTVNVTSGDSKNAGLLVDKILNVFPYYARYLSWGLQNDSLELTLVQGFPGQRGAIGYSAPGFIVVSEDVVKYHDYPGYAPEFLPHEIAHQWFPIEVTLAREEDGWLAEGLAEYLAWRFLQDKNPAQARLLVARAMRDALAPEPLRPLSLGLRLFALEDPDVTRATLYQRGMLVFRTLETVIDRERVDRVLREYYRRYAGRAASIADFRKICEEVSGRDLSWFFDYFINGTQIPEIQIRRTPSVAPGELSGEITVRNVPPEFSVRVEMRLETPGGPIDLSVATRGEVTPFTVTSAQPVTRILLDPDQRILRVTEAAQRNRSQRALLASLGELERAGQFTRAAAVCEKALALDRENLAWNEQQIRFLLGRLRYRMRQYVLAYQQLTKVLALGSLDPLASDFNRAWSRVYRARIEQRRGHAAAARAEAQAGIAMKSPALETRVAWPDTQGRESSAAEELRSLSK